MAIGTTGTLDRETGERRETQFSYTPVDPQEDMMRQAFERSQQGPPPQQPQGPTPYWEDPRAYYPQQRQPDPIAQAKAATAAAYKFIAFRGYQQDLKEGKSAADAFAKWGPMLVQDTSFGPAMKALTPAPQPAWIPANAATGQPGAFTGRVTVPPRTPETPRFIQANPLTGEPAHYEGGGRIQQLRPESAPKLNPIDQAALQEAARAEGEGIRNLKKATTPEDQQAALGMVNWARNQRNTIAKRNGLPQITAPKPPIQPLGEAASPLPSANEIVRLTKDGKRAIFDADTKKFIRYAD